MNAPFGVEIGYMRDDANMLRLANGDTRAVTITVRVVVAGRLICS